MEIPTVIGLGLGFDGTSNWINKHVVDKLILGVDEFKPEEYTMGRKFLVHTLPTSVLAVFYEEEKNRWERREGGEERGGLGRARGGGPDREGD